MYNVVHIHDCVSRIGGTVIATKKDKNWYKFVCEYGSNMIKELAPVKYSKNGTRLFTMNMELIKGTKTSNNEKNSLILAYLDGLTIRCDQRIRTKDG